MFQSAGIRKGHVAWPNLNSLKQVTKFLQVWQLPDCGQRILPLMHKLKSLAGVVEPRNPSRRLDDRPGRLLMYSKAYCTGPPWAIGVQHCLTWLLVTLERVAYWLKHWSADWKVQGSNPTCSRDLFLFWVHTALSQKLSRRFTFVSFGGRQTWGTP